MRNAAFKERALVEGARYAKDKMVFLRELCQNARDAGAEAVEASVSTDRGFSVLTFKDDGTGMSFSQAEQFLFTLYASSKENDTGNAGKFGVGFWSILLSDPVIVSVESRTETDAPWKVVFNRDLEVEKVPSTELAGTGTRVTLRYAPGRFRSEEAFVREVERALLKYCRHLRKAKKGGGPLPIYLNGVRIDRPFAVDGPHYMTFDDGDVQGAVGLSESPSVSVFARGLLVWQGSALDELRYGAARRNRSLSIGGLAPCYVLNGDSLNATLDRRALIDDGALKRLRSVAESRMDEFVERYLDCVSPMGMSSRAVRRMVRRFREGGKTAQIWGLSVFGLVLVSLLWIVVDRVRYGEGQAEIRDESIPSTTMDSTESPLSDAEIMPLGNRWRYVGSTVGGAEASNRRLTLVYRPEIDLNFRIAAMERLDTGRGIGGGDGATYSEYAGLSCNKDCLHIAAAADAAAGFLVLPMPTGYSLDTQSVRVEDRAIAAAAVLGNEAGEPVLRLSEPFRGQITYTASRPARNVVLSAQRRRELTTVPPEMMSQKEIAAALVGCRAKKSVEEKVRCAAHAVQHDLAYDDSENSVRAYKGFYTTHPKTGWMAFVFREHRGDCDVLNTVLVVLLRAMGIASRLAIGSVGSGGRIAVGTHAWAEYVDGGWRSADASVQRRSVDETFASSPKDASPSGSKAPVRQTRIATPENAPLGVSVENRDSSPLFTQIVGIAAMGVLFSAFVIFRKTSHAKGGMHLTGKFENQRVDAARMAAAALADPLVWQNSSTLLTRKILVLQSSALRLSVQDAKQLAALGRLYVAVRKSELTTLASAFKTAVLDGTDAAYKELSPQLTGAVDLDEIAALNPMGPSALPPGFEEETRLLYKVDSIIKACHLDTFVGIRLSLSKFSTVIEDVSLPGIWENPYHLVVIPVTDSSLREALNAPNPDVGAVILIERAVAKSDLLYEVGAGLLFEAARRVFEGAA